MELKDAIYKRRSIRNFKNDKIERNILNDILKQGILSPSGHNRQPWYFIVIEDSSIKESVADLMLEKDPKFNQRTANAIKQAPILIAVYDRINSDESVESMFDMESIGACMQNIVLSATDHGLGSLWIGLICQAEKEINQLLNIDYKLVGAVAIGYANEDPSARPREDLEKLVIWK